MRAVGLLVKKFFVRPGFIKTFVIIFFSINKSLDDSGCGSTKNLSFFLINPTLSKPSAAPISKNSFLHKNY